VSSEEEIIKKIMGSPKLLDTLAGKIFEKIKDHVVIKRIEELEKVTEELVESIKDIKKVSQNNTDQISLVRESQQRILKELGEIKENKRVFGRVLRRST